MFPNSQAQCLHVLPTTTLQPRHRSRLADLTIARELRGSGLQLRDHLGEDTGQYRESIDAAEHQSHD
jgi:hypothetical protein